MRTVFVFLVIVNQWGLFADASLGKILANTLTEVPAPAAVWKETFFKGRWFPVTFDFDSIHSCFSAVKIGSGDEERYVMARSALYTVDSDTRSFSYYFVLLFDDEIPSEIVAASGSSILYASGRRQNLPIVRERLREAETLATRYSKIELRPSFQIAFPVFLLSAIGALLNLSTEDPKEKRAVGSVVIALAGLGTVFSLKGIVEEIQINTIRKRIQNLWE